MQDGVMKWSAVNSDTDWDLYGERMSLGLYHKMLSYIKNNVPPPEEFRSMVTSDFWKGGMPYLSIAHYSDLNGKAVPGQPSVLYVDGNQLKAKGILFDTPLGRAVWKSLKADEIKTKSSTDEDRIRISIAFLDLAHKHGEDGQVFHRKSLSDVCPECRKREGNKIYVDGYLVHLALTRVPVNPRSLMEVEKSMAKGKIQTRKEDALSIVGDESLVEEIAKSALEAKSDILVEMSDTESIETPVEEKAKKPPMEEEDSPEDEGEDMKEKESKKGKKECSLTEGDIEVIRNLISEVLPKPAPVAVVEPTQAPEVNKSALDLATDTLYTSVNSAIQLQGATLEQRLESINPALQELGSSISALVRESMGQPAPVATTNETGMVLEAVNTLAETVKSLATEVATMKAQQPSVNTVPNRVPVPRSIQPQLVTQSQAAPQVTNPNSVANIVRRSVSSQLPLK